MTKFGYKVKEETKQKLRDYWKGKTYEQLYGKEKAEKLKKLRSLSKKGDKNPMFGRCLEKSPNWNGGRKNSPYNNDLNEKKKDLIRYLHMYRCTKCLRSDKKVNIHHIDHNKKNDNINNLTCICKSCHSKIHQSYRSLNMSDH